MNASRGRCFALALFAVLLAPLATTSTYAAESPLEMLANSMKAREERDARNRQFAVEIDEAAAKKDWATAIAIANRAVESDPGNETWLFSRGHFHMWLGDFDAARADFDKAIELDGYEDDVLRLGRVQVNLYAGRFAEAEEALADALDENYGPTRNYFENRGKRDDDDAIAAYGRGRCWLAAPTLSELKQQKRAFEKEFSLDTGSLIADPEDTVSPEKALAEFDRAIALHPTLAPAYAWRGKIHADKGANELALADFEKAVEFDAGNIDNIRGRAAAREATGDLDGAVADFSKVIELKPDTLGVDDDGRFHRARVYAKQGMWELALADYNKVERSHVASARIVLSRAMVHARKGDTDSALADIRKGVGIAPDMAGIFLSRAIESEPDNAWLHIARGFSQAASGQPGWAMDDFGKAIELDADVARRALGADVARAFFQRGVESAKKKEYDAALTDFTRAIALAPDSAAALAARGTLHAQMKNAQLALDDFNGAVKLSPDDAATRYKRGMIFAMMNEDELAINDFTRVIELEPNNAQAYIRRAALYKRVGFEDRFQADYARAIELDPSLKR